MLTEGIDAGFRGRLSPADAHAAYERRRNEATRTSYAEAVAMAAFLPFPPEVYAQRAALRPAS